jgi:capsular exopolysaccharide synthesis family protein
MNPETSHISHSEKLDFGKLRFVLQNNWLWIVLILLFTNGVAFIYVRYSKDLYEAESEIKLDIKQDATELGIRNLAPDRQPANIISAEIETIKSKLFLSTIIDSLKLDVTYLSIGKILDTDLHRSTPFTVTYQIKNPAIFDIPIYLKELNTKQYQLTVPGYPDPVTGTFGEDVETRDFIFRIHRTSIPFEQIQYAFIINSRENSLRHLQTHLVVEPLNVNANTIRVAFTDSNPYKAADIVNGIDSIYMQYSNAQKNLANQQKIAWLNNELHRIEQELEGYESYLEAFTLQNRTSNVQDELKNTLNRIYRIDSQRYELNRRVAEINRLADDLQTGNFFISGMQRTYLPDALIKSLEKLQELTLETSRLSLSYQPGTLVVRQRQQEQEELKKKISRQLSDIKSTLLQRLGELTRAQANLEKQFSSLPDKNMQFNKQLRYYRLYEELYLMLMQKKSEFEIAMAGSTPDFKILSTATPPANPVSPGKLLIYAAGLSIGLFLTFVFVGLVYLLSDKITSLAEVEKASGVPLLGSIPAFRQSEEHTLYVLQHPRSMVSEALRSLRTNLEFFNTDKQQKVIAVSSTVSGEGKSFLASNLSAILALSGKKVILLDVDLRKPAPAWKTDDPEKGMSTLLIGKHTVNECIRQTDLENLHHIPPGPIPPNPAELLLHNRFSASLSELKKTYDFIVMDTPPVGLVTDGIMAMRHSDMVIYVFRANYSSREFFQTLKRIIRINKFKHITAVLNALPTSGTTYGYGYYHDEKPTLITKLLKKRV